MYKSFRQFAELVLRIPGDPAPPPGDDASTRIFLAAPNYYKYLLCLWGIQAALGLLVPVVASVGIAAALLGFAKQAGPLAFLLWLIPFTVIFTLYVLWSLFLLAVLRLNFEKRWYIVTDRSLRIREGVTTVREMTVNFANIQNISISQGPLQRLLGITDLRVDTAGGGGGGGGHHGNNASQSLHTAWFRGINNANDVRELIQKRLRRFKDSGLGDHEEAVLHGTSALAPALLGALRKVHEEAVALRVAASRL